MDTIHIQELDRYLFHEGTHDKAYTFMGAHVTDKGVHFVTWAPHAKSASVVGDFNQWQRQAHPMKRLSAEGLWHVWIQGLPNGTLYKYAIQDARGNMLLKSDPFAFHAEVRPNTASAVYDLSGYQWQDQTWMTKRSEGDVLKKPINVYEVNLSSWRKFDPLPLTYENIGNALIPYVLDHGYTHIELMPIMEHPFDGSWGYQITGYYAVTSRFGSPHDLMRFIDQCHQVGIGVILDWVPGHYCKDAHGLAYYDGEALYEPNHDILRENLEWGTMNFDYGRPEVRSYLIGNANYWLDVFHADGLRVDAVAYMLYRHMATGRYDLYTEQDINQDAISFLQQLNTTVFRLHKNIIMAAEESSAFPMVTRPVDVGGLGFNLKWNMGWMHDSLKYMSKDPIYRPAHHDALTFSIYYTFNENFIMPLSHDEVVHGKKSLIGKMPGDYWQKFANFRLLMAYQIFHPGKKLNFMGNEFAQFIEWNEWDQLDWHLLAYDAHKGANLCVKHLNHLYQNESALYETDHDPNGFEWIEFHNASESIIAFRRIARDGQYVIAVYNFTPVVRRMYGISVPEKGHYEEVFNSDYEAYYGSGIINPMQLEAHLSDTGYYIKLDLPPLGAVLIKPVN